MLEDLPLEALESVRHSIHSLTRMNKAVGVSVSLGVPIIIAVLVALYDKLVQINVFAFWLPLVFLLAVSAIFAYFTVDGGVPADLLVPYLTARDERKTFSQAVDYLMALQELVSAWQSAADTYISQQINSPIDAKSSVTVIMETLVQSSDALFNFKRNELWNFGVYLYDPAKSELWPAWRECSKRHPSTGLGRSWKPTAGHIGLAFSKKAAVITPNAKVPEVAQLLKLPTGAGKPYDNDTYVSFISQPIPRTPDGDPWGVVVATSNVEDRFNEVSGLALRHAAAELGAIFSLAYKGPILTQIGW